MKFNVIPFDGGSYDMLVIMNKPKDNDKYNMLIDTGASFPVWAGGVNTLKAIYPLAEETPYIALLGGFGGVGAKVPVWKIPIFVLSDGSDFIIYRDLYIAVSDFNFNFVMIMSFPMLRNAVMSYTAPAPEHSPELQLSFSCECLKVDPIFSVINGVRVMNGVYAYVQADYTFSKLIHDSYTLKLVKEKHANYEEWFSDAFPNGASNAEEVLRRLEEEDTLKRSVHDIANDPVIMLKAVMLGISAEDVETCLNQLLGDETTLTNNEIIERLAALIHE